MIDIVLTGKQKEAFRDALTDAFRTYDALKQMLSIQLDKRLETLVGKDGGLKKIAFTLIEDEAEAEGWLYRLLKAARTQNPGNPKLIAFEKSIGLATRDFGKDGLEALIRKYDQFFDLNTWLPKLNAIEKQVCRIEINGKPMGTGFLVAPDVVLTNYHVVEKVIKEKFPAIICRFDYRKIMPNAANEEGITYNLAADWLIDSSPYSEMDLVTHPTRLPNNDELDYALLRLNQPLNERGFVQLPTMGASFQDNYRENAPLFIVQHPEGEPIKLALDTESVIGLNDNATRLFYKTYTLGGSSGSPCFNANWDLIALHHYGEEYVKNGGIPITALMQHWESKGIFIDGEFIKG